MYSPSMPALRDALAIAVNDADAAPPRTSWRFVSDRPETVERLLLAAGADRRSPLARDLGAAAPQYVSAGGAPP